MAAPDHFILVNFIWRRPCLTAGFIRKPYNQKLGCIGAHMSTPLPVAKVAAEEQMRLREQFVPIAQKYRQRDRCFKVCLVGCAIWTGIPAYIAIGLGLHIIPEHNLSKDLFPAWLVSFLPWGIASIVFGFSLPRLECPACHNRLDSYRMGHYCPECGNSELEAGNWLRWPKCNACGKRMLRGKRRRYYKIRACTHCRVILDEIGI